MAGPQETAPSERIKPSLDDRDRADLENQITSTRELADEIEGLRKGFINRAKSEGEGVISELEAHRFVREAKSLKSRNELQRLEEEFNQHLLAQRELMERAGRILGERSGLLNEGEEEEIMARFPDMSMKQKEKEVQKIRKMMDEREKKIKETTGLDEEVRKRLEQELREAENYEEKLKKIEQANETNRLFQKYKKLWEVGEKISNKTKTEYFEWFLSLSQSEQKWALDKARKEDIEPRVALYDLHDKLPDKYKSSQFGKLGKTDRLKYLSRVEKSVQQEFTNLVWSKDTDMSTQSKAFAIKSFQQIRGKDAKVEGHDGILEKIKFLEKFPEHARAEAELRTQLEKFPPELRSPYMEQFNRSSFEEKVKIIGKVGKLDEKMQKCQEHFNKFDQEIKTHFETPFSEAQDPDEREKVLDQMKKFQELRKEYFRLRTENDRIFGTDISVYEKWYNEHVTNMEEARKALSGMKFMVKKRLKIFDAYKKLDSRVQKRCPQFEKLPTPKKMEELKKLKKLQQNLAAIDALKDSAEALESSGMEEKALNILKKARKLDPEDKDIIKAMKRLAKKLGCEKEIEKELEEKPKKDVEEYDKKKERKGEAKEAGIIQDEEDEKIFDEEEEEIEPDGMDFGMTEVMEMRRAEETVEMVEDNVEKIGGNIQEDSRTRAKKEYKGGSDLEQEIIEEVTSKEQVVGRGGKIQKVIRANLRNREDLREVQNKVTTPRKRDARKGVVHVEIRDEKSEDVLKTDKARERLDIMHRELIDKKVQDGLMRLKSKGVEFSEDQIEAVEKAMREQAEDELARKVEAEKVYKQTG